MSFLRDKNPLVVVGDAARVRLFAVDLETEHLVETAALVNTAAHQHARDLTADRDGRSFDRQGGGRHALAPSSEPKSQATAVFARDVAAQVQEASVGSNTIVLIAAPRFLGLLRKQLSPTTKSKVSRQINKDLTTSNAKEIEALVKAKLKRF